MAGINANWKDVLARVVDFAKQTFEDYLKSEAESLKALGETGVRFGKITGEALLKHAAGQLPTAEYDEVRKSIWNATKSELLSKGYDEAAKAGDVLQNSLAFASGIIGAILGGK